ncbi:MAG TPA: enolase C-terminal domain-like protein [Thermoanaerobaculia bacterium]|nr:enolase C-terminal domain-like protein [Thermoanaerobaculia bacterium]
MNPTVERLAVAAYTVPTAGGPESDGTLEWESTTMVVVEAAAGGAQGIGYSYAHAAAGALIEDALAPAVVGGDALSPAAASARMRQRTRNLGQPGLASCAVSAVDVALWDLKAKLLGLPLVDLLGAVRESVPVYGSGGFTSESAGELEAQLGGWAAEGIRRVKMKVGRRPEEDPERVAAARRAVGPEVELMVDANGAFSPAQALALAERFAEHGVTWFEEPVSSDDAAGLAWLCRRAPPGMEIAAGEYAWRLDDFRQLLAADAVDVLQADATRCGGVTGFLAAAALGEAHHRPLSAHCAPALHVALGCACAPLRHLEWFADHVRIERAFFDGAPEPIAGEVRPDRSRPGLGLELRREEVERYRAGRRSSRRAGARPEE